MASPEVPRRRSLDLDHKGKPHSCCDELLMSLEEAEMLRSKSSPLADDVAALSLNEHHTLAHESVIYETDNRDSKGAPKLTQELKKRRRYHTADSATTERAIKLLEKIKDSKKDASATAHKHSKLREEEEDEQSINRQSTSPSKSTGSSRHNVLRHLSDTAQPKDKAPSGSKRSKDNKLLSRASVD
ncbi:uncharacterized protein LOC131950787 [Physella acuta]|uniref:uncharacterized protein LOC131950787 n=1 Tax=Physella acuta TaxID=109671 RepID=UPI0027DC6224|nr:uncharacterized protein LOC131950787 [Physella acuta]